MAKQISKMNKNELINKCVSYGVIEAAEKLGVENKRKDGPTNADYIKVLEPFKDKINGTELIEDEEPKEKIEVKIVDKADNSNADIVNAKPLTGAELTQVKTDDLFRSIPVIVTDHDTSHAIENDITGRGEQFGWGNPAIGMQKESVFRHGRVQYLYIGTIKHISKITIREKSGKKGIPDVVRKRFTITEVPNEGFSQAKLDVMKTQQMAQK